MKKKIKNPITRTDCEMHGINFGYLCYKCPQGLSKGILESLYTQLETGIPKRSWVYFQGKKYKTGSKSLKTVLDKWYELNAKE